MWAAPVASFLVLATAVGLAGGWAVGQADLLATAPADPGPPPGSVRFVANGGRLPAEVAFSARASGYQVFLTRTGLVLTRPGGPAQGFDFVGADASVEVVGVNPLGSLSTHVRPAAGGALSVTALPDYAAVRYRNLYPGIDAVFRARGELLEYDLEVAPGADPSVVELSTRGGPVALGADGSLVFGDGDDQVAFRAPFAFQDRNGRRHEVASRYRLVGEDRFGFSLGTYDPGLPLVIDPVLKSASFLGGMGTDTAYDAAVAPDGGVVVVGFTESEDFPVAGAQQGVLAGEGVPRADAFVTKLAADGSGVVWSTYLGGSSDESAFAVAVGSDGSVYVTGFTESEDFPVTDGAFQTVNGGGDNDTFVTKLDPSGAVVYSGFLGGAGNDGPGGIGVAPDGSVVVAGATSSVDFPVVEALASTPGGSSDIDAYVTRISPDGSSVVFSTYLGGSGDDKAVSLALDPAGDIYVAGDTASANFPVESAYQPVFGGSGTGLGASFPDAFVTKLAGDGSRIVYSTFLGGSDSEQATAVTVDAEGHAYVTGNTGSANFPVVRPFAGRKGGDFDTFVTRLNPEGSGAVFSTYLGGSGADNAEAIAVGPGGIFVAGTTRSDDFPTSGEVQGPPADGALNGFVAHLDLDGRELVASTYLGGGGDDQVAAVAIRPATAPGDAVAATTDIVVVGFTASEDFPTLAPFQAATGGGSGDVFVAELTMDALASSGGAGGGSESGSIRVWVLAAATLVLLGGAVSQTLYLRSRPAPAGPEPARMDQPVRTVGYVPRRGRLEARSVDGRSFGENRSAVLDDSRRLEGEHDSGGGPEGPGPEEPEWSPAARRSTTSRTVGIDPPDWDDDATVAAPGGEGSALDDAFARFWDGDEEDGRSRPARLPEAATTLVENDPELSDARDWLPADRGPGSEESNGSTPDTEDDLGEDSWLPGPGHFEAVESDWPWPGMATAEVDASDGASPLDPDDLWRPGTAERVVPSLVDRPSWDDDRLSWDDDPEPDHPQGEPQATALAAWWDDPDGPAPPTEALVDPREAAEPGRSAPIGPRPADMVPGLADPGFADLSFTDLGRRREESPPEDAAGPMSVSDLLSEDLPIPADSRPGPEMSMRALLDEGLEGPAPASPAPAPPPPRRPPAGPVPPGLFDPDPDDPLVQATQPREDDEDDGSTGRRRRRKG